MTLEPTITNDGKEKHQSFKAEVSYDFMTSNGSSVSIVVTGYGKDEFEARRNFIEERGVLRFDTENTFKMLGEL